MTGRRAIQRVAAVAPVRSLAASPSARPAPSPPQASNPRSFADLERIAGFGHRFGEIPIHSPAPPIMETAGTPPPAEPLPTRVRGRFERLFGADFSDVRMHRESTLSPGPLRAFTRGAHVHFAPTRFQPDTAQGDALIGHELAHVTQQRERRVVPNGGEYGTFNTQTHLEREALRMGERAARGEATPVGASAAKPQAAPGPAPAQAGLFDLLGPANPRLYAPTWLGGHSRQHLAERQWQGRSGPMDMLGPANPRLHLPTALGGHSHEHLAEREIQGRSGPLDLLGPLNPRRYLPTALGGHSEDTLRRKDNTPEQLLKRHPSTFLRSHPIESDVEFGGHVANLPASAQQNFFLSRYRGNQHRPAGYVMHQSGTAVNDPHGPDFGAGFLPMRQMAQDTDAPNTVAAGGTVRDADLDQAHEDVTMTTQLSGCSITHQGGCLQHLRPDQSGAALQNNLDQNPGHTYGGNDYHGTAFVMMKKERNGRTRIHHQEDAQPGSYGSRYLS